MEIKITENTSIDGFMITAFSLIMLACLGVVALAMYSGGEQVKALADLDKMGCGELKEFIADKGWKEYGARYSAIEEHARHTYIWTCEK